MTASSEANGGELRAEILALYQVTAQDLTFFKQQQWSVTNYALVLDAGLLGVRQVAKSLSDPEKLIICIVATGLGILGLYLLRTLERSITARRERLEGVRIRLSQEFRDAWRTEAKEKDTSAVAFLLAAAQVLGAAMLWWLVWFKGA